MFDSGAMWAAMAEADEARHAATVSALAAFGVDGSDPFVVHGLAAADWRLVMPDRPTGDTGPLDHLVRSDSGATAVTDMTPGVGLLNALLAWSAEELSTHELTDVVAGWERLAAWVLAGQATAAAALTRRPEMRPDDHRGSSALHPIPVTAGDLCCVFPWTKPQAERMVSLAVDLVEHLPRVHRALTDGRIDKRRAGILVSALRGREPELVLDAVLPQVHSWTSVKVSQVVNRLLHQLAPEDARQRHRQARAERRVWIEPGEDGMAWLYAYLPADDAQAIMATITAAAEALREQDRDRKPRSGDDPEPEQQPDDSEPVPASHSGRRARELWIRLALTRSRQWRGRHCARDGSVVPGRRVRTAVR